MRKTRIVGIVLVLILAFFYLPIQGGLTGYTIIVKGAPILSFEISSVESFYEGSPFCYSDVKGIIFNKGFSDAEAVTLSCKVLVDEQGILGESKQDVGLIEKRSSKSFSIRVGLDHCVPAMIGQKYDCNLECMNCVLA